MVNPFYRYTLNHVLVGITVSTAMCQHDTAVHIVVNGVTVSFFTGAPDCANSLWFNPGLTVAQKADVRIVTVPACPVWVTRLWKDGSADHWEYAPLSDGRLLREAIHRARCEDAERRASETIHMAASTAGGWA